MRLFITVAAGILVNFQLRFWKLLLHCLNCRHFLTWTGSSPKMTDIGPREKDWLCWIQPFANDVETSDWRTVRYCSTLIKQMSSIWRWPGFTDSDSIRLFQLSISATCFRGFCQKGGICARGGEILLTSV